MQPDKRAYRKMKRDLKRAGSKRRRRHLQRELTDNPEDAAHSEFEFGRARTSGLNGNDRDSTRRREE
jgi:hypothetical protein